MLGQLNREVGPMFDQLADRRTTVRYPVNAETTCPMVVPIREDLGSARIKDVSLDGIGLLMSSPVEPGAFIMITLKNEAHKFFRIQLVQVIHSTRQTGGYLVGGTFVTP